MVNSFLQKNEGVIRGHDFHKPHVRFLYAAMLLILVAAVLISIAPLVWVIISGFKEHQEFVSGIKGADNRRYFQFLPQSFKLNGYVDTWNRMKYVRYYLNSLYVVIGSVICALLFNGLTAYSLSHIKPRGYKIMLGMIMATLMVPATTSLVPLFINITKLGLNGTFLPLWLVEGCSAFFIIIFKSFYDNMPASLLEVARLDGCNELSLFFRIVLPLSMPVNMVIIMYAINGAWSDFLLPYLVLRGSSLETVMVRLYTYQHANNVRQIDVIRAIVFCLIPPLILFAIFQKRITGVGISAGIKG